MSGTLSEENQVYESREIETVLRIRNLGGLRKDPKGTAILIELVEENQVIYRMLLDVGYNPIFEEIKKFLTDTIGSYRNGIQSILISHIHADHIECLPMIYEYHRKNSEKISFPEVYMTDITKQLFGVIPQALYYRFTKELDEESIWDKGTINAMLPKLKSINFEEWKVLSNAPKEYEIKIKFHRSGHMAGSATIEVFFEHQANELGRILYTGDFCATNSSFLVDPLQMSELEFQPYTALIFENTRLYLEKEKGETTQIKRELAEKLGEVIGDGGNTIMLVTGIDEASNILAALQQIKDDPELVRHVPVNTEIYLDTYIGKRSTEVFEEILAFKCPHSRDYFKKELLHQFEGQNKAIMASHRSLSASDRKNIIKEHLKENPCIVIATKPSLRGGTCPYYLANWGYNPKNLFLAMKDKEYPKDCTFKHPAIDEDGDDIIDDKRRKKLMKIQLNTESTAKLDTFPIIDPHASYNELKDTINKIDAQSYLGVHFGGRSKNFSKDQIMFRLRGFVGKTSPKWKRINALGEKPIELKLKPHYKILRLDKDTWRELKRISTGELDDKRANTLIRRLIKEVEDKSKREGL